MTSDANGVIVVPVWSDDGVVKPIVNDDGRIPIKLEESTATQDVDIVACSVTLPAQLKGSDVNIPVDIKACSVTLPVQEQSPLTSIQAQTYGWDLSNWRKLAILWGFTDRYSESMDTVAGGTNINIFTTSIPAGYVFVVQSISVRNNTSGPTTYTMFTRVGVSQATLICDISGVVQWRAAIYNGEIVLKEGDSIGINVVGCTIGDTIHARTWGYKMKVNE